jgi:hypothetical protein
LPSFRRTVTLFNPLVYLISGFRCSFLDVDEFTVPLCRGHHREVHRCGDEANWWNKIGIDPLRRRSGTMAEYAEPGVDLIEANPL